MSETVAISWGHRAVVGQPLARWLWLIWPFLGTVAVGIPLAAIASSWWGPPPEHWAHLVEYLLARYILNTIGVIVGVGILCSVLGLIPAWLVAGYDFPGRRWLQWALVLPLAFPAYVLALVYANLLDSAGPVQQAIRWWGGYATAREYWFPQILSLPGVVIVLSLALYPYVYLICRPVLGASTRQFGEAAQLLGHGPWSRFRRIELPLVYPALIAGATLCMFEALADYGSVFYYGVDTFTVGIYRTWFNLGDLNAATRLASLMLLLVFCLLAAERWARRGRVDMGSHGTVQAPRKLLSGGRAWAAASLCVLPVLLGFALPSGLLALWAVEKLEVVMTPEYWAMLLRSLSLAAGVSVFAVGLALLARYAARVDRTWLAGGLNHVMTLGYAIPGAVVSVGILVPMAAFDHWVNDQSEAWLGWGTGLLLSGSLFALGYAYVVRFLAVACQAIDAGFARLPRDYDAAANTLGEAPGRTLRRVHVPLLRGSLLAATILVAVDILKELPATLILRPFNFDTLATKTFELAGEEQLAAASIYGLSLVALGLLPILFLTRFLDHDDATPTT